MELVIFNGSEERWLEWGVIFSEWFSLLVTCSRVLITDRFWSDALSEVFNYNADYFVSFS